MRRRFAGGGYGAGAASQLPQADIFLLIALRAAWRVSSYRPRPASWSEDGEAVSARPENPRRGRARIYPGHEAGWVDTRSLCGRT